MVSTSSTAHLLLAVLGLGCVITFMSLRTTGRITLTAVPDMSSFGFAPVIIEMKIFRENQTSTIVERNAQIEERPEEKHSLRSPLKNNALENLDQKVPVESVQAQNTTKPAITKNENSSSLRAITNETAPPSALANETAQEITSLAVESPENTTLWPPPMSHIADSKRRIVLLIVNCGYIDMADNLIQSLVTLNVTNFILVPLDETTQKVFEKLYPERTVPIMPGLEQITETATYGSEAFKALTASRANIVHKFLEQQYTVLYCDLDMVWRKNALEYIANETDTNGYELVVVNDHNRHTVCSCFLYMKPTPNNLQLLQMWDAEIRTGRHEQDQPAFQAALAAKSLHRGPRRTLNYLKIAADTTFLPSGKMYFKLWNDTVKEKVMIVHNNYIRGHDPKQQRFANFSLWNPTGKLGTVTYSCGEVKSRRLDSCSLWLSRESRR